MDNNHDTAYLELKSMYEELQSYLSSVIVDPEEEVLLLKCEQLGDKIYAYHAAIIKQNSHLHAIGQESIKKLINQAKDARESLKNAENKVKCFAQVANAIDKIFELLGKFL
ncbi:hypothetical protein Q4Q49_03555 [Shewanella sp. SP1S1-7]|uniref:hypothetical protein n=1 Tax=Shewanella TaxID=22 RepID=UPI00288D4C05|nr:MULTISPECIES: hypothetical protein [unclassified Shewanella]MDT3294771.1 hypothetical protein [Shewanella sp. SP2S2-6]MDT3307675.1 hypothetical protein [Shewanella sp. SP1S1-4]MDT3334360.1 hypothetical protein [Shewanella sp. SP1S1-7]